MKILVIGAGAMGTALASIFSKKNDITLWIRRKDHFDNLQQSRVNEPYLPDFEIPSNVNFIRGSISKQNFEAIILALPTQHLREVCKNLNLNKFDIPMINTAKGLEINTFMSPCQILEDIGLKNVYSLSGPSHAEEICKFVPTSVVLAGKDYPEKLMTSLSGTSFRPYYNQDRLGVELGGALKNVIAIAVGISEGMGYGMNTTSAIVTRGLSEIKKYGVFKKVQKETFNGLSCLGDLITTCCSPYSRNKAYGKALAKGQKNFDKLAEGAHTVNSLINEIQNLDFDMPLCHAVYEISHLKKDPLLVMQNLINRPLKEED